MYISEKQKEEEVFVFRTDARVSLTLVLDSDGLPVLSFITGS